eukprot:s4234_g5.t1
MRRAGASDALSLKFSSLSRTLKFQSTLEPEAGQADFPLTVDNKPLHVVLFGLQMTMATRAWSVQCGENISCRVGVHTGECVGGMVGTSMQRYHLFGDLMRGLEILESTAPAGQVQVSRACKSAVEQQIQRHPQEVADVLEHVVFQQRVEDALLTLRLVTFGPRPARAFFERIPRAGRAGRCAAEAPSFANPPPFPNSTLGTMLRMEGLATQAELHLVFPMRNLQPWVRSRPMAYLDHIVNYARAPGLQNYRGEREG